MAKTQADYSRKYTEAHREELNQKARELRAAHPERQAAASRRWALAHPDRVLARRQRQRQRHAELGRLRRHGVSADWYRDQLVGQAGRCAICTRVFESDTATHIDHDHETGAVRGLLCHRCNSMIGLAKESPRTLRSAIQYIVRSTSA